MAVCSFWLFLYKTNPGCPDYTIIGNFNYHNFSGVWYEMFVSNFENSTLENNKQCSVINLISTSDYTSKIEYSYMTNETK